jgi:signal peptidase II
VTRSRTLLFCAILAAAVGCDHATKQLAQSSLAPLHVVSLARDTVRLQLASNPGGLLSLGAGLPWQLRQAFFLVLVPLAIAAICWILLRPGHLNGARLVAAALIAGGGLANWLDRMMNSGTVTDFVSVGVGPLRTGIFNFADVVILAGIALALLPLRSRAVSAGEEDGPPA